MWVKNSALYSETEHQTNPEMTKTGKRNVCLPSGMRFRLALKGYYTQHQSSILKYKASLLKLR